MLLHTLEPSAGRPLLKGLGLHSLLVGFSILSQTRGIHVAVRWVVQHSRQASAQAVLAFRSCQAQAALAAASYGAARSSYRQHWKAGPYVAEEKMLMRYRWRSGSRSRGKQRRRTATCAQSWGAAACCQTPKEARRPPRSATNSSAYR